MIIKHLSNFGQRSKDKGQRTKDKGSRGEGEANRSLGIKSLQLDLEKGKLSVVQLWSDNKTRYLQKYIQIVNTSPDKFQISKN